MREYRGKRKDNGEFVYGWYVGIGEGGRIIEVDCCDEDVELGFADVQRDVIDCAVYPVDPASVGQSTGLKDKNGVEIFEGQRVKVHKFCQELGENMGVVEGEREFEAVIKFSPYGGVYLEAGDQNSGPLWEYEDGFHEESLEIIHESEKEPGTLKSITNKDLPEGYKLKEGES